MDVVVLIIILLTDYFYCCYCFIFSVSITIIVMLTAWLLVVCVTGLSLDVEGNKLYWVSRTKTPKVYYCQLSDDSTCQARQYQTPGINDPFSLTIYHKTAYYASSTKIVRVDLAEGGTGEDLRTDTPHVSALQVYDPTLRNGQ